MESRISLNLMLCIFIISLLPRMVGAEEVNKDHFRLDIQGDLHYSRYNFTDIKNPYDGIDIWTELKAAYWLDERKSLAPYISIIPSYSSEGEFWWQRNVQFGVGFEWYPIRPSMAKLEETAVKKFMNSSRLYALYAYREYYDKPSEADPEKDDLQIGADVYYDNLFDGNLLKAIIWSNASFRTTNFSLNDYDGFIWSGNTKVGPQFGEKIKILPYVVMDWTYSPKYDERWWENFLRLGAGVSCYPMTHRGGGLVNNLLKRLNFYAEVQNNVAWLGQQPHSGVKDTDYRIGLSFSTFFERGNPKQNLPSK